MCLKSSRFKSWMKYSRRKNLHCFLKETMALITYSASTKNELWTLFGLAQVRVKTSSFIPPTLVGQKLFSGKKIHTRYVKIYGAIVVIAVVHVDFSFMDSDLVTRMRLQHVRSFFSNKLIASMESKPCWRVFFVIRQINGRMDCILGKTSTYKINLYITNYCRISHIFHRAESTSEFTGFFTGCFTSIKVSHGFHMKFT